MLETKLKYNQNLLDIAIQEYGSINEVQALEIENNVSRTDVIAPGTVIKIPKIEVSHPDIQTYFTEQQIKPATASSHLDFEIIKSEEACNLCELFM